MLLGLVTFVREIEPSALIPRATLLAQYRLLGLAKGRVSGVAGGGGNRLRILAFFVIGAGTYRRGSNRLKSF